MIFVLDENPNAGGSKYLFVKSSGIFKDSVESSTKKLVEICKDGKSISISSLIEANLLVSKYSRRSTPVSFLIFLLSNILIVSGREITNTWSLVGATILNVVLNLAWIPVHGALGAAWATVVCEMALILVLGFQSRKYWKSP